MAVCLALLAGCAGTSVPRPTSTSSSPSGTGAPPTGDGCSGLPFSEKMLLANCTSWQAPALFPGTTAPGSPPAGWKPAQAGTPLTGVGMYGYRCARIHVGPFERGPIYLLTDTHNNADMPANCTATREPTNFAVVSSFWIDDAAVGDYLNRTYGLPVVVGTFHEDTQTTQSLTAHVWSWTTAGKGSSKLTIYDDQTSMPAPINNDRLFWARDGGISSLELQYERS